MKKPKSKPPTLRLEDYPLCADYVKKCVRSLEACAKELGFDLKTKKLNIHEGYLSESIDDYTVEAVESAFTAALIQQINIHQCLERSDFDSFALSLAHLSATSAFLSSLVRKKTEHEASRKFERVRLGHETKQQAKDKTEFQAWVRQENILVTNIKNIWDEKTCPVHLMGNYDRETYRAWCTEVFPNQLRSGRPKKM